ncbi:hypothetical protein J6590_018659 [Homalodisca vitripennis]|nr:hypothetical protein J6590_018659 [Homalodisca vitripennis]
MRLCRNVPAGDTRYERYKHTMSEREVRRMNGVKPGPEWESVITALYGNVRFIVFPDNLYSGCLAVYRVAHGSRSSPLPRECHSATVPPAPLRQPDKQHGGPRESIVEDWRVASKKGLVITAIALIYFLVIDKASHSSMYTFQSITQVRHINRESTKQQTMQAGKWTVKCGVDSSVVEEGCGSENLPLMHALRTT